LTIWPIAGTPTAASRALIALRTAPARSSKLVIVAIAAAAVAEALANASMFDGSARPPKPR
jgi:hypothetical protein